MSEGDEHYMAGLTEGDAVELLKQKGLPENVLEHVIGSRDRAVKIAEELVEKGVTIDIEFLKVAALLHDIGYVKVNRQSGLPEEQLGLHAPYGKLILQEIGYDELAEIAGGHTMTCVPEEAAKKFGWPCAVRLPDTLEAKIVCIAEKCRHGKKPEQEIEDLYEAERNYKRYWNICPELKDKIKNSALGYIAELRRLGWSGKI